MAKCFTVKDIIFYAIVFYSNDTVFYFGVGKGAMAEVSTIVSVVKQFLQKPEESSQKT